MKAYTRVVDDVVKSELHFHLFGEGAPQVFFTGGLHGGEATGIYVAERIVEFLHQNELKKGSVKVLPVGNPTAFRRLQRTSPYDELDLNRIFPGVPNISPSMAVANVIWQEAQDASYIVDLHCCGIWGSSYTLAVWKQYDFAKELANMLDIPAVIESGGTRGQLFTNACDKGIPAVIIELPGGGQGGVIDMDAADKCYAALINMLRQLDMIEGEGKRPEPSFYGKLMPVMTHAAGAFVPCVKPGSSITKGQTIGKVGEQEIVSPVDGAAIMVRPACYVFKGMPIASVAPVA